MMHSATLIGKDTFYRIANGTSRTRLFSARAYDKYKEAYEAASAEAAAGPYYATGDTGGVANKYGYATTTAQWAVWRTNAGEVVSRVGRVTISGRHVPHAYYGGERQYLHDYDRGVVRAPAVTA